MKRTLVIALALLLALTMGVVVLAEGLSDDEAEVVAETTEVVAETMDAEEAEEAVPEAIEDETEGVPSAESTPDDSHTETITQEEWLFCYCLDHFYLTMWPNQEDDRYTLVIENRGDADGTITLFANYGYDSWYETGELEGRETAYYGAEIITISLPAGEKTVYTFEPGYWYNSMGYAIIGASYEDISYLHALEGPVINHLTLEEYLAQCTHSELVVKTA